MTGSTLRRDDSPVPTTRASAHHGRVRGLWHATRALCRREAGSRRRRAVELARILDLFEEHVYAGEITADGRYIHHASTSTVEGLIGGPSRKTSRRDDSGSRASRRRTGPSTRRSTVTCWRGEDAEVTYRVVGLDGVTRIVRDRARPRRLANGNVLVEGLISDVTAREEAAARLDEASGRFASLLDVVGAHVYLALALPDGRSRSCSRARVATGCSAARNPTRTWSTGTRPCTRTTDPRTTLSTRRWAGARTRRSHIACIGADGITRWVHDRAACRPRPDGTFEVSGIVSDVTERRHLEDELKRSMREMKVAHRELERARADAEVRAGTDELTGTFNRRHFAHIATEALAAKRRRVRPAAARRRQLQGDQRRVRPRRRRRRPDRPRPPAERRPRARRLPGALGRRGVRHPLARRPLGG